MVKLNNELRIKVTPETKARLTGLAAEQGVTLSDWVRVIFSSRDLALLRIGGLISDLKKAKPKYRHIKTAQPSAINEQRKKSPE